MGALGVDELINLALNNQLPGSGGFVDTQGGLGGNRPNANSLLGNYVPDTSRAAQNGGYYAIDPNGYLKGTTYDNPGDTTTSPEEIFYQQMRNAANKTNPGGVTVTGPGGPSVDPPTGPPTGGGAGSGPKLAPTAAEVAANPDAFKGTSFDPTRSAIPAQGLGGGANTMGNMQGAQNVGGVGMYTGSNGPLDTSRFNTGGDVMNYLRSIDQVNFAKYIQPYLQQNNLLDGSEQNQARLQQLGTGFFNNLLARGMQQQGGGVVGAGGQTVNFQGAFNNYLNDKNAYGAYDPAKYAQPQQNTPAQTPAGGGAAAGAGAGPAQTQQPVTGGPDPVPPHLGGGVDQKQAMNQLYQAVTQGTTINPFMQMMNIMSNGEFSKNLDPNWSFGAYTRAGGQAQGYDSWLQSQFQARNEAAAPKGIDYSQPAYRTPGGSPSPQVDTWNGATFGGAGNGASGGGLSSVAGGGTTPASPGAGSTLANGGRPPALPGGAAGNRPSGQANNFQYYSRFA